MSMGYDYNCITEVIPGLVVPWTGPTGPTGAEGAVGQGIMYSYIDDCGNLNFVYGGGCNNNTGHSTTQVGNVIGPTGPTGPSGPSQPTYTSVLLEFNPQPPVLSFELSADAPEGYRIIGYNGPTAYGGNTLFIEHGTIVLTETNLSMTLSAFDVPGIFVHLFCISM